MPAHPDHGAPLRRRQALLALAASAAAVGPAAQAAPPAAVREAVPDVVQDAWAAGAAAPHPADIQLGGWLGARLRANADGRLMAVDLAPLLAGFRQKPGNHAWIGEHIGKWIHAATLAWAGNANPALRSKLDGGVAALIAAQEADGYLGTYPPGRRLGLFKDAGWDVWSHKYCLVGLLTYHRYTGNAAALQAAVKAADLLLATFPAKRSILQAGYFNGLAATSVLEPMVALYRRTGDARYLDFCRYIVAAWQEPGGPDLVRVLLTERKVAKVPSAKAYEMLSNLVGLCELARVTGEKPLIDAALNAWRDIVDTQRFLSGTTSDAEFFQPDEHMAQDHMPRVGETCVTTTWIQFNQALFQLTGEARFGNELERSYYNALAAAQHPAGHDWGYFTPLNGRKTYDKGITCCHSSGPRGMALAPLSSYLVAQDGGEAQLLVSTFETSSARLTLAGQRVGIEQVSGFPAQGTSRLTLRLQRPARFGLKVRVPDWAGALAIAGAEVRDGWACLAPRTWRDGDEVAITYALASTLTHGSGHHAGRGWLNWGPFVLAYEHGANAALPPPDLMHFVGPARLVDSGPRLRFEAPVSPGQAPNHHRSHPEKTLTATLVTYADAGADGGYYRLWLRRGLRS